MNYKETLYFIGKCLTICLDETNKTIVKKRLELKNVDWDSIVKLSTAHNVLPALYCNFKRSNFLHYLPEELAIYMEYITNLNRERNKEIIKQAKELNTFLLENDITPIFLKGTANLLAGVYEDIGERMIGDIDFIFSRENYLKAIKLLRNYNYSEVQKYEYYYPGGKHYRRLKKDNSIAAIEIHSEILVIGKYRNEFNYNFVEKDSQLINDFIVLSYANKLNLSIIADQINDNGFYYRRMPLRNAYDVFLLSKKTNAKDAVNSLQKLRNPLNCFLAACYEIFNNVNSLEYNKTKMTNAYLNDFNNQFTSSLSTKIRLKYVDIYLFIRLRLYIIYYSIIYKEYRIWLFRRLTDKQWLYEKQSQLGLKNNNK